jgi:hypothetical protein
VASRRSRWEMDEIEKPMRKVVKDAVQSSSNGELSAGHADRIKDLVRSNPEVGPMLAWSAIVKYFGHSNVIKRCVALEFCNMLFLRSQKFRSCVIDNFDTFELLLENCGQTKQWTKFLADFVFVLNTWKEKFGANSQKISLAIEHLKLKMRKGKSSSCIIDAENRSIEQDKKEWEEAQLQAQIEAEFSRIKRFADELEKLSHLVLTTLKDRIGGNLVESSSSREVPSRDNVNVDQLLGDLGLMTSNYELQISVEKPRISCDKRHITYLKDGAMKARTLYLPRLVEWEEKIHKLGVNKAGPHHLLHPIHQEISSCCDLLSRTLRLLDSVSLESEEISSGDEMEDVQL